MWSWRHCAEACRETRIFISFFFRNFHHDHDLLSWTCWETTQHFAVFFFVQPSNNSLFFHNSKPVAPEGRCPCCTTMFVLLICHLAEATPTLVVSCYQYPVIYQIFPSCKNLKIVFLETDVGIWCLHAQPKITDHNQDTTVHVNADRNLQICSSPPPRPSLTWGVSSSVVPSAYSYSNWQLSLRHFLHLKHMKQDTYFNKD